tara:strand:- start:5339 stop:6232 length:894 start_codon:yes stop_codon:yes gene_type:complete
MKKLLLASALALTTTVAVADPIYLDVGFDFGGNANFAVDGNTTGWVDQLTHLYQSESNIVDLDDSFDFVNASSLLTDGDTITTNGGFSDFDSLSQNLITGLNPSSNPFGGPSDNAIGDDWGLTFTINNLVGTIAGGANQFLNYTSGAINFFYYDTSMGATTDFIELFTINVTGSGLIASGSFIAGTLSDFGTDMVGDGADAVLAGNVFNSQLGGFKDYADSQTSPDLAINSLIDYNTENLQASDITLNGTDGDGHALVTINGQHDGSMTFSVPEPTSLAILGLGLLGFAASSRKKSA